MKLTLDILELMIKIKKKYLGVFISSFETHTRYYRKKLGSLRGHTPLKKKRHKAIVLNLY